MVKAIAQYTGYNYTKPNEVIEDQYIVKKGDTLYSISKLFQIPIDELIRINNLSSNILSIGQVLKLKDTPKDNIYIVQKGDTLYSIASKYNITVDEIKKINNLSTNTLSIGQQLYLPEEPIDNDDYIIYKVQKGDSLWSISKKYNIPINELIEINNLLDLNISIDQPLLVPNNINNDIYIVEKGDTIFMGNNE